MTMKSLHDAYLTHRERDIRPCVTLKKKLANTLFMEQDSQKSSYWNWRLFAPFALGIVVLALFVVQSGRMPIFSGGSDSDSVVTAGGGDSAAQRELRNFACLEGCDSHVRIIDTTVPEKVYFDSGDCDVCNEIVLWANHMEGERVFIGGYASIGGYQRTIPSQTVDLGKINEIFTFLIPSWSGSGWDSEHPVKTLRVSLKETHGSNLIDDIQCDGGCGGYNILTERDGSYKIIHEGCSMNPCSVYELYQAPAAEPNGYQVALRPSPRSMDRIATLEFSYQYTSQELAENPTLHVVASVNDIVCEFDLTE